MQPFCKFSRQMLHYLETWNVEFDYFDIMYDSELRDQLKQYSNWQTYPQLYIEQQLVGGNDVVLELEKNGEIQGLLEPSIKTK